LKPNKYESISARSHLRSALSGFLSKKPTKHKIVSATQDVFEVKWTQSQAKWPIRFGPDILPRNLSIPSPIITENINSQINLSTGVFNG